jgi:glutamate transport system ATP-binding protein
VSEETAERPGEGAGSAARGDSHLVDLRGIRKSFDDNVVLDGVDLAIDRGEAIVVAGPSGSGKSTMLRCINGLEKIDEGAIHFDGHRIETAGKAIHRLRAEIGMVFQQFNLFPHMTVLENVALAPRRVNGVPRAEAEHRARRLLERVGIPEKADAHPADLSGGQQQRVAIARALAMEPKLMLFDEPTSALDPEMIREVLDVMRGLAGEGMTMVVVTHELRFARKIADSLVMMDEGRVIEEAPPELLFENPAEDRTRRFLAAVHA